MMKATTIAMLLMAASSVTAFTPKIASQEVYDAWFEWRQTQNATSSTKQARDDSLGYECCPVSGLSQITSILQYDAVSIANYLGTKGTVFLPGQTCTLLDCDAEGGGLMACNFNAYEIGVAGTTLGAFSDWLASYCTSDGWTCGVGLDYTLDYNVWTQGGACSI